MHLKVIDKILDDCKNAIINGKPLLFLRTNELEIVRRVVESDCLVVRLSRGKCSVDEKVSVMTRSMNPQPDTRLFLKDDFSGINYNIRYIFPKINNQNKNVLVINSCISSNGKYRIEDKEFESEISSFFDNNSDKVPTLYIVQNSESVSRSNLLSFIDGFLSSETSSGALNSSRILFFGEKTNIPEIYDDYCEIIDEPYPETEEIKEIIIRHFYSGEHSSSSDIQMVSTQYFSKIIDNLTEALRGFSLLEVERIVKGLSYTPCKSDINIPVLRNESEAKKAIRKRKEQILKKTNLLELVEPYEHCDVGGMESFTRWIKSLKKSIRESDTLLREMGAFSPKGCLLCGIPGCGKSYAVEVVRQVLDNIPILKMDIGQLMGKYVGESEHNMTKALKIAEAMSPCILLCDELDKGFSGASGGSDDSSVSKRMFGTLLSWMQSCKKPVFIFATANDISHLPDEFFRSGRYDGLYSIFMPTNSECIDIFTKQMEASANRVKDRQLFDDECYSKVNMNRLMSMLAKDERFVTGADITKIVQMALRKIWSEGNDSGNLTLIKFETWIQTIEKVLKETSVYGDGENNRRSIVACYIRLFNGNFISTSDNPLFTKAMYKVTYKYNENQGDTLPQTEVKMTGKPVNLSEYDEKTWKVFVPLIEEHGPLIQLDILKNSLLKGRK